MANTGLWTKPGALQCLEIMTRNKKETVRREKGKPGEHNVLEAQ